MGWISSLYHIISPTFSLSFCASVLEGAGLPEVYVCDCKQQWHFSDNTKNRPRHARAHALCLPRTHPLCLPFSLPCALSPATMSAMGSKIEIKKNGAKRRIESMPTNTAEALKPVVGYSGERQMPNRAPTCLIIWSMLVTLPPGDIARYPPNCHRGDPHNGFFCQSAGSFLQYSRHPLTNFLYDLDFPSMNLLWAWQCAFVCRRLEYKYGCCA